MSALDGSVVRLEGAGLVAGVAPQADNVSKMSAVTNSSGRGMRAA
jgi:hypothetical protein